MENGERFDCGVFNGAALAFLTLALATALMSGLVGCGQSHEELIRGGVESELAELKAMEGGTWDGVLEDMTASSAQLAQYGVDSEELCRALIEGFDYRVAEVAVSGSTATVEVETACKSLVAAVESFNVKIQDRMESASAQRVDASMVGELLMEAVEVAPVETTTVSLPYQLKGSAWEPAAGFEAALMQMFGM